MSILTFNKKLKFHAHHAYLSKSNPILTFIKKLISSNGLGGDGEPVTTIMLRGEDQNLGGEQRQGAPLGCCISIKYKRPF
jgi:hypothetical protein